MAAGSEARLSHAALLPSAHCVTKEAALMLVSDVFECLESSVGAKKAGDVTISTLRCQKSCPYNLS